MQPVPVFRRVRVADAADLIGRWMRVMVQANWSRSEGGYINVWINGNLDWQYQGATTNADEALYFKYGVYRAFVSRCGGACPTQTAYYRDVRRGTRRSDVE